MSEWKLVPSEPNADMLRAAVNAEYKHYHPDGGVTMRGTSSAVMAKLYRAAVAASPPAPDVVAVLNEAALQIEYLHDKFQPTGSGNAVVARLLAVLAQIKGEKP